MFIMDTVMYNTNLNSQGHTSPTYQFTLECVYVCVCVQVSEVFCFLLFFCLFLFLFF